jgi:hypothetical protein
METATKNTHATLRGTRGELRTPPVEDVAIEEWKIFSCEGIFEPPVVFLAHYNHMFIITVR